MSTYWEKRAQESVGRWENAVNQKTKEMAQAFEEAKKAIEGEIYSFYGRYAKNNQITMEEAKKALSRKELAEFKGTLAEYERLARNSIGTFNLEVENLSMKARLIRLDALMLQIDGELQRLYQQLREDITQTTEKVLIEEYYHTQYNLSVEAGRLLAFSKIPKSFIEQVLAYPIAGADISTRLWKQGADTSFFIRQTRPSVKGSKFGFAKLAKACSKAEVYQVCLWQTCDPTLWGLRPRTLPRNWQRKSARCR